MSDSETRLYRVAGRVIDRKTRRGIKDVKVEAWDKDLIIDDLLGSAITGDQGGFAIRFDESDFRDLFLDREPDLYFKVFRGDELIKSTEDSVLWNVEREDIEVEIEVNGSSDQDPNQGLQVAPGLQPAARGMLQATYTPREPRPEEDPSAAPRALEKSAFFAQLAPSQDELRELANCYQQGASPPENDPAVTREYLRTVEILSSVIVNTGKINILRHGKQFACLEVDAIVRVAQDLIEMRQVILDTVLDAQATILEEFTKAASSKMIARTVPAIPSLSLKTLMEWAVSKDVQGECAAKSLALAESLSLDVTSLEPEQFSVLATRQISRLHSLADNFREEMAVERVGYLHLERMSFTPAGIERGELVYSVPLSPGEEVNIKHREWSQISEEFEQIITDYMEEFSEEGVTEKSELAESVDSQTQHSTAFNTGVTASGSYQGNRILNR